MPDLKTFQVQAAGKTSKRCLVKTDNTERAVSLVNHALPNKVIFAIAEIEEVRGTEPNAVYEVHGNG